MRIKKQFKAESKRLLDLMIHSIYTHKEIFLRELISNASDAIDKLYYRALSENLQDVNKEELAIELELDKENRTITIRDNGIGMDKSELEENLGTIAKSGSLAFKEKLAQESPMTMLTSSASLVSDSIQRLWWPIKLRSQVKNTEKQQPIAGVPMPVTGTRLMKPKRITTVRKLSSI